MDVDRNSGKNKPRILIVGGVAGGASCATRARRLSEKAEIIIFERGPYVSFANCGLPYYVGDLITDEENLIAVTPDFFRERFKIDVRTQSNVTAIDREKQEIQVEDLKTAAVYREKYDALVLAPGAAPIRPPLPGIDLPGIYSLRTIPDSRNIREWIITSKAKSAVIVGGGFVGLEMAENLAGRGISVTIIEMQNHVMPALDHEMVAPIHAHLKANGVSLHLEDAVTGFKQNDGHSLTVSTKSGKSLATDLVILAIGVRPEVTLAESAGLETGERGGIRVNDRMKTGDDHIWAVGDAVEVRDFISGEWIVLPLAGPASRQGRTAASNILGRDFAFRGVQATAICGIFGMTIASTGLTENTLLRLNKAGRNIDYEKVYLYPDDHASYYPGASQIAIKMIFSTKDGRILGAQAVGREGADKRMDVFSMAIQNKATVFDLEEAELCYAPQYGTAKDPINVAGMIAANALRGDAPLAHWEDIENTKAFILDVRNRSEFISGHIDRALNIPLNDLRTRLQELPAEREIWVYCASGQRSYYATRILRLHQFNARNLGGIRTYKNMVDRIAIGV
ncbi:MAG: FAD-dependent oxidoreductase [Dehalococcoidales bacterium]|nr:FAD-dependent oxidoreductase [Dehalococcoidales bacterium]